jgi:ubiquinone/menaquinone biosynthesis C-methylase UbiE
MKKPTSSNPWDWMQAYDAKRFGEAILDPVEQTRWCRAVMLGGLPYMWNKAEVIRAMIYDRLALHRNDKVLLLGECLASCGFVDEVRERIGEQSEIRVIDITEQARDAYLAGKRGSGGQLATWRYNYTSDVPGEYFDCVAVLQGVQHAEDWRETGRELLRVMKPGRNIVLAEITFSPELRMKAQLDIHIEYVFEKLFSRIGWEFDQFPYYSPKQLQQAFAGMVASPGVFSWRGIELFWGSKPLAP